MMKSFGYFALIGSWALVCFPLHGQTNQIQVRAGFQPSIITLNGKSTYKITILGTHQEPRAKLPLVPGITLSNTPNVSRSYSIVNGVSSTQVDVSYAVKPTRAGTFSVPSWTLQSNGQTHTVPMATLRVLPPSQEDLRKAELRRKQQSDLAEALFLEASMGRSFLHEGETIRASVKLFIWDKLPVTGVLKYPQKIGPAFSQSRIDEKTNPILSKNVSRNGKNYTVYSWPVALTAAMRGIHELQYSMTVAIRVQDRRSPFRDPFLIDPLFGFGRGQPFTATSGKVSLEVKALPMNGRPASFRGAIGSFETHTRISSSQVAVGDPVNLTFSVKGKGNFEAMLSPEIPSTDNLRVSSPKFYFEGDENMKYEGIQRFEYVLTPLKPGVLEIPAILFSFFNPETEKYIDASNESRKLRAKANSSTPQQGEPLIATRPPSGEQSFGQGEDSNHQILFQTQLEPGNWHNSLAPSSPLASPVFWYSQIFPLGCFVTLLGWRWYQNSSSKDSLAKRLTKLRGEMKDTVRQNDTSGFFQAARRCIQEQAGSFVDHDRPMALASDEVLSILGQSNFSEQIQLDTREILEACDTLEFAGENEKELPLKEWLIRVRRLLRRIRSEA